MGFFEVKPEDSKYKVVYVDLVHRCNMECANCYLPNRLFPDMDADKIISVISRFTQRTEFRFIGGEPTLHKELPRIIKAVHDMPLNHRVAVVTNGLKMASKRYTQSLKNAGLKTVYLSMTGFDDDEVYKVTDELACAKQKMRALQHCIDAKLIVALGCIVIKGINEHVIKRLKDHIDERGVRVSVEFRNVGQVGRYMRDGTESENYSFEELIELVHGVFGVDKDAPDYESKILESNGYGLYVTHGRYRLGVTNWSDMAVGFSAETNLQRGRITQDFKVAPFLEHVRANENGY